MLPNYPTSTSEKLLITLGAFAITLIVFLTFYLVWNKVARALANPLSYPSSWQWISRL